MRKEEHSVELLKNFSKGDEARDDCIIGTCSRGESNRQHGFFDLCEELEALEKRVIVEISVSPTC
jgi:hypothetical protein